MSPNDGRVGLCTIANKDRSVESVMDVAADAGCDGIELWGKEPHLGDGSTTTCRELRAAAERRSLEIPVYGSYLRPGTDSFAARADSELRIAADLGASLIRVWAGEMEYQDRTTDHWNRTVSDLERLSERAGERGLGVTVERHAGTLTNSTDGARAVIDAVDSDHCGLNWQPSFDHSSGDVETDAATLAPLSNNVHIQALAEPDTGDRCALAGAYFDVDAVLGQFRDQGFEGYVEIEFVDETVAFDDAVERDCAFVCSALQ